MGGQCPPTLAKAAIRVLLRDEASVISSLEGLPIGLFPEIFEEAFTERRTNVLRAMAHAWPFPCLPARALIKKPCLETLRILLESLDMIITGRPHPRSKLKVLNLTDKSPDFWNIRFRTNEGNCSPEAMAQKQSEKFCPKTRVKKPFMVETDLNLCMDSFTDRETYLLHWFQQNKSCVHLCCRKLFISEPSVFFALKTFNVVPPECISSLTLSYFSLELLAHTIPYLSQMRNLHTLEIESTKNLSRYDESVKQELIHRLLLQIYNISSLKNLKLFHLEVLTGSLENWLRYMRKPLEGLSIIGCKFLQEDIDSLSQHLNICELRHLNLSDTKLSYLYPKALEVLLGRITRTLQTLQLEACDMYDYHFNAILPALSQCSQLTKVNFYSNNISLLTLKNLLHHTAKLRKLTEELYPVPMEWYGETGILRDQFQELCPQLLDILRAQRQLKSVTFAARPCLTCHGRCFYDLENGLYFCK